MIKAVIFDFFGVLVTEGFKKFCDTYFPDDQAKRRQAIELINKHDSGVISSEKLETALADLAGVDKEAVHQHMGANEPNTLLLDYIKSRLKPKYKIGVLSNSGDDYINQMLKPSDVELFDDVLLSYRHGIIKPQSEIFELAAFRLDVCPQECLFIDDSPSHCDGARRADMKAILYENFQQTKRELEKILAGSNN